MRTTILFAVIASVSLGACGLRESRINPFNWFGQSTSEPVVQEVNDNPLIPRGNSLFAARAAQEAVYNGRPFEQVTDLRIERVPGGAIIRATGLAARQGIYDVRLTPANEAEAPVDGVLTYRLEGVHPSRATAVGTPATREVIAARKITDQTLIGVRSIRVEGQLNARVVRR